MRNRYLVIFSLLFCFAPPTVAQDSVERYLDVWPYFLDPDAKRLTNDRGLGVRTALGFRWRDNWFSEIQAFSSVIETGVPGATDYYLSGLGIDLVYAAGGKQGFSPFILLGGGIAYNDTLPDADDGTSGYVNLAVGTTTADLSRHGLRLRVEVRYFQDFFATTAATCMRGSGSAFPSAGCGKA